MTTSANSEDMGGIRTVDPVADPVRTPQVAPSWLPIETAPRDGSHIWAWLNDCGIRRLRWSSAEEAAAMTGSDEDPADYDAAWVEIKCPDEVWEPRFWLPLDALPPAPDGGLRATLRSPKLERYE